MVNQLKEGNLYKLNCGLMTFSKNGLELKGDTWLNISSIYLYLDYCPYSETHSLLNIKENKIVYTKNEDHLLLYSDDVIYGDIKLEKTHEKI